MKVIACVTTAAALVLCAAGELWADPSGGGRLEGVLSWDDGAYSDPSHVVTAPRLDYRAAVMFQAPEWATQVVAVQYYVMDDGMANPSGPDLPTTEAFFAHVWQPGASVAEPPGASATGPVETGELYPEDAWLEVRLPQPVSIESSELFPDRIFFVGLEWIHRYSPQVGYDNSEPIEGFGWVYDDAAWSQVVDYDLMVRAVVSDGSGSPVSESTWSVIKAAFK